MPVLTLRLSCAPGSDEGFSAPRPRGRRFALLPRLWPQGVGSEGSSRPRGPVHGAVRGPGEQAQPRSSRVGPRSRFGVDEPHRLGSRRAHAAPRVPGASSCRLMTLLP